MMRVVASNCGCCGVKHIRDFPPRPQNPVFKDAWTDGHDEDEVSTEPEAYLDWLNQEGWPDQMTAEDAFKRILEQIQERRPSGFITLNLAADCDFNEPGGFDSAQVNAWRPLLLDNGFTEVEFMNSNSSNRVHHFFKAYD